MRDKGRKREGEKHKSIASRTHPTGDQIGNLGTWPDWETNLLPFSLWDDTAANQATLPKAFSLFIKAEVTGYRVHTT